MTERRQCGLSDGSIITQEAWEGGWREVKDAVAEVAPEPESVDAPEPDKPRRGRPPKPAA